MRVWKYGLRDSKVWIKMSSTVTLRNSNSMRIGSTYVTRLSHSYRTVAEFSYHHFQQESVCVCTRLFLYNVRQRRDRMLRSLPTFMSRLIFHTTWSVSSYRAWVTILATLGGDWDNVAVFGLVVAGTISPTTCPQASGCHNLRSLHNGTKWVWEVKGAQSHERNASSRRNFSTRQELPGVDGRGRKVQIRDTG